ncbi:hypothetical protein [Psychromonas hadalis]|uniref:hypothetical protein n=1 Tax=Psychromonas hadalis TaxID=211669 RepID=UPI0003B4B1EF|nr:hypothetical protein [Psychromonas hadalis]
MKEDPSNTPSSNKRDKLLWWKMFCGMNILFMYTLVLSAFKGNWPNPLYYVEIFITFFAGIVLFLFVSSKAVLGVVFWRYFFYVCLIETIIHETYKLLMVLPLLTSYIEYSTGLLYSIMLVRVVYLYSYKSHLIWDDNA